MKNVTVRATLSAFLVILLFAVSSPALARGRGDGSPFWWSFDMGYGSVGMSHDDRSEDFQDAFFLGFRGGIRLEGSLLVGAEVAGWTMESEDTWDSERGEGITQYGLVAMLAPPDTGVSMSASVDWVDYWNNRFPEYNGTGWSTTLGIGYTFDTGLGLGVTPSVSYTFGRIRDDDYADTSQSRTFDIVSLKMGLSYVGRERGRARDW